ncbi:MAG: hypothetical protein WCE62_14170 [Polyangiales bacterium]
MKRPVHTFYFHEGAGKLVFLRALRKRLPQWTPEPVLLPLNPEDILHFLPSARVRTCPTKVSSQSGDECPTLTNIGTPLHTPATTG